jgi:hypothetical protein
MLIEVLATSNFLLGAYDAWLTQRRMRAFGVNFELNRLIKAISVHLGPELAAIIGILGPCVGWTYIFFYFHLTWTLALMVGFNLKRFEMQLSSAVFEKQVKEIQKALNGIGSKSAPLPDGESTPKLDPTDSLRGK